MVERGNIQIYTSPGPQPPGVTDALLSTTQKPLFVPGGISPPPAFPSCLPIQSKAQGAPPPAPACEPMGIVYDTAGLPKYSGSQLVEYTLGAVNQNITPTQVPHLGFINYWMDTSNIDFDVSYVNVAWAPIVLGTFVNNQVGYTGTPQTIDDFKLGPCPMPDDQSCDPSQRNGGLTYFMNNAGKGWPQFRDVYQYINAAKPPQYPNGLMPQVYLKFPSLLEVFQRLTGANAPTDLAPLLDNTVWTDKNQGPLVAIKAWPPIAALFSNWTAYAGPVPLTSGAMCPGSYTPGTPINKTDPGSWCLALLAQKALLIANYNKYVGLFPHTCNGTPVALTDAALVSHLYGFTPWVEATGGTGCGPKANLLQDTPGYFVDETNPVPFRNYAKYHIVKTAYDNLNYDFLMRPPLPNNGYLFNPYNALIHNPTPNLAIPCAYGYSVDDAQGNVQAEAQGFIIDVGSVANLDNMDRCGPLVNITLGPANTPPQPVFKQYQVCNNLIKPVVPGFTSFDISAKNPSLCPVNAWDGSGRKYTFTLNTTDVTKSFPFFANPANANWKSANHQFVQCGGNNSDPSSPQYATAIWCCNSSASNGIYAFSQSAEDVHQNQSYKVITLQANTCTDKKSCDAQFGTTTPCNPPQVP